MTNQLALNNQIRYLQNLIADLVADEQQQILLEEAITDVIQVSQAVLKAALKAMTEERDNALRALVEYQDVDRLITKMTTEARLEGEDTGFKDGENSAIRGVAEAVGAILDRDYYSIYPLARALVIDSGALLDDGYVKDLLDDLNKAVHGEEIEDIYVWDSELEEDYS